ncbi:MAG: dephospho-CoA kinase [Actinomycetota bacterium]|nr:dephospho-CoA kinase [Actinomycetota bacterium]MDH5224950.1 dephospho-CoA kinase [Actinomycetota bacterium]MDH5313012.1 dephospho-CoA kinase [Actinomycetota bacterium]
MLLVGLTGGIGSGKSTVAHMLAARGAVVLDADTLAREAVAPGTPGFEAVIARFGAEMATPDGSLDRAALASVVFDDDDARSDLEAIVHPEVRRRIAHEVAARGDTDDVVVVDSPLLIETGAYQEFQVVIVVTAAVATRVARLVARGMADDDVRARMRSQMPLEEKAAYADVLLDNEGPVSSLERQVSQLWSDLRERALSSPA